MIVRNVRFVFIALLFAGSFMIFPKTSVGIQGTDCKEKIASCLGTSGPGEIRMCSPHVSGPKCDDGCGAGNCKPIIIE